MANRNSAWLWVWAVVATLVCLAFVDRACRADEELRKAKAEYAGYRAAAEADHAAGQKHIAELTTEIGERDERIAALERAVIQNVNRIGTLERELAAIQGDEPPTTPDIEAMPIVINLRAQVAKLAEMFTLSQNTVALQTDQIKELEGKFSAQVAITDEWKASYDREHALRLQAEGIFKVYERKLKASKTWRTVALAATAGALVYGIAK